MGNGTPLYCYPEARWIITWHDRIWVYYHQGHLTREQWHLAETEIMHLHREMMRSK